MTNRLSLVFLSILQFITSGISGYAQEIAHVAEVKASSFIVEHTYNFDRYHPLQALDQGEEADRTAWNEAVPGPGINEWFEIDFTDMVTADKIYIQPGYYDPAWYHANNRIKRLVVSLDSQTRDTVFPDGMEWKAIDLGKEVSFKHIRFTIKDIYKGSSYNDTCISRISFSLHDKPVALDLSRPLENMRREWLSRIRTSPSPAGMILGRMVDMGIYAGDVHYFFKDGIYVTSVIQNVPGSVTESDPLGRMIIIGSLAYASSPMPVGHRQLTFSLHPSFS